MPRYIHPHSLIPWEWLYHATIYPPHSLVPWEWLYHATIYPPPPTHGIDYKDIIFSLLRKSDEEWIYGNVIFSFPAIFGGGDYIVTLYFHPWQYLMRGWIYRDIFSLQTIFGEGGDYIVTLCFHPWQYLVRGWLYHDIIFSLLIILVRGWLYRDIIFSLLAIFGEGVNISWHIFTPDNI